MTISMPPSPAACGWPRPLTDAEVLDHVVALNTARAPVQTQGVIRWLRPDYQKPLYTAESHAALGLEDSIAPSSKSGAGKKVDGRGPTSKKSAKLVWPKFLAAEGKPATAAELAARFARAQPDDIAEILHTLVTLGRARPGDAKGTFVR